MDQGKTINTKTQGTKFLEVAKKKWVLIAVVALVLLIVIRIIIVSNSQVTVPTPSTAAVGTQLFSDSAKYFYIKVPSTWTTTQTVATATTGEHTANPKTQNIEISQMYLPNQVGVTVQVYEGAPTCPLAYTINATLGGYPASYNPLTHQWVIPTTVGTIAIGIAYPGSGGFHEPMQLSAPTPVGALTVTQDELLLKDVLATFTPINLIPFSCGTNS
jgi:hypothetical protein